MACGGKAQALCQRFGKGHSGKVFGLVFVQKVAKHEVLPNPFVSAETLKACALIGLHLLAAEGEDGSTGGQP